MAGFCRDKGHTQFMVQGEQVIWDRGRGIERERHRKTKAHGDTCGPMDQ